MFQLNKKEFENWKSQYVISNSAKMGLRKKPYVFTEQGVAMLSSVLNSKRAVQVKTILVRKRVWPLSHLFIAERRYCLSNAICYN